MNRYHPSSPWLGLVTVLAGLVLVTNESAAGTPNDLVVLSPELTGATASASPGRLSHSDVAVLLDCIFEQMGLTYQLAPMPPRRADHMFANGVASAILDAFQGPIPELPNHTAAIMPQQWAWFFNANSTIRHDDPSFQDRATIAVPAEYGLGRHMTELGFRNVAEAANQAQLAQLLFHGRVDAVLATRAQMLETMAVLGIPANAFRSELQATWHLVVRFRDEYAAANPDVIAMFAAARVACGGQ